MNEQQEQIVSILHKLTAGEPLNSDEHNLLLAWTSESSFHDDLLKKVQDDAQLADAVFQRLSEDKNPAWNNLVNLLSLQQATEAVLPASETGSGLLFLRRARYWYAAALIIFFVTVAYFWLQRWEKSQQVVEAKMNHDVLPGKNGAILTLADGSKVVLDSLANGIIAHQGKTTVTLDDGKLKYNRAALPEKADRKNEALAFNTITTPKGRQYQLVLPDGSKAWLNAASSIRYPVAFTGGERMVEITGEVYFEVATLAFTSPDDGAKKRMPFIVKKTNDNTIIRVLGTHFNVNAYPDEADSRITLLEGSVQVNGPFANPSAKTGVVIKPGQQVVVNNNKDALNINNKVDLEAVMAWKEGYFSFNQTTLADVMRQLARWYDVDVVYEGPAPTMTFWGGISRSSNLSQVVKILEKSNVHFRIEDKKIIVTK